MKKRLLFAVLALALVGTFSVSVAKPIIKVGYACLMDPSGHCDYPDIDLRGYASF